MMKLHYCHQLVVDEGSYMIELTRDQINPTVLIAKSFHPDCGAIVLFLGTVREFTLTKKGIKEYDRIIRIYFDYIKSIIKCKYIEDIYNDLLKKYRREFNLSFSEDIVDSLLEINILLNNPVLCAILISP